MKAIVLFSGGLDSTTCLLWALRAQKYEVTALCFDYGQRHAVELEQAAKIAAQLGIEYDMLDLRALHSAAAHSALTRKDIDVAPAGGFGGLPSTFVPGRNLVFLTLAASYALSRGVRDLVTGVCQTDHAGYPDCRRNTIDALERAVNLGNEPVNLLQVMAMLGDSRNVGGKWFLSTQAHKTWGVR